MPGEQNTLPIETLGARLMERAVAALMLGGDVPVEALLGAIPRGALLQ
ncbi:hypothetical protein ACFWA5_50340 [Streptomyces mirabilis]